MKRGRLTIRLGDNGYYYMQKGSQHRHLGAGTANSISANHERRPSAISVREDFWRHGTPYTPKAQNPSRSNKPSKLQRLMSSTKRAKQKRMAKALSEYLKVRNPGTKLAGAKVIKNAGGSITIIPIKLRRAK